MSEHFLVCISPEYTFFMFAVHVCTSLCFVWKLLFHSILIADTDKKYFLAGQIVGECRLTRMTDVAEIRKS